MAREAGCHGGEVGVGKDALPGVGVLAEPAVVTVHALVVAAGGRRRGLAVSLGLGRVSFPV